MSIFPCNSSFLDRKAGDSCGSVTFGGQISQAMDKAATQKKNISCL
jgi:hypothetical protein